MWGGARIPPPPPVSRRQQHEGVLAPSGRSMLARACEPRPRCASQSNLGGSWYARRIRTCHGGTDVELASFDPESARGSAVGSVTADAHRAEHADPQRPPRRTETASEAQGRQLTKGEPGAGTRSQRGQASGQLGGTCEDIARACSDRGGTCGRRSIASRAEDSRRAAWLCAVCIIPTRRAHWSDQYILPRSSIIFHPCAQDYSVGEHISGIHISIVVFLSSRWENYLSRLYTSVAARVESRRGAVPP